LTAIAFVRILDYADLPGHFVTMKLVAVCRVRNEVDIVEAFVRHHCAYFHKLIILDDGSTDQTLQVLRALQADGLPLVVLSEQAVAYEQSRYMTLLMRLAVDQFGADWVAPLDADEFIEPPEGLTLAEVLAGREPQLYSLSWNNFVWTPESSQIPEPSPVVRLRLRLSPRRDCTKLLVPARLVDERVQLMQGNHELLQAGKSLPAVPLESVCLCHFPIRDPLQYAAKIAIGYLKYAAMAERPRGWGFHYLEPFQALLAGGQQALEQRMSADSLSYSLLKEPLSGEPSQPREAPLRYLGGPLKHTPPRQMLLSDVLLHAEALAKELATRSRIPLPEAESGRQQAAVVQSSQQLIEEKAALKVRLSKLEIELRDAHKTIQIQSRQLSSRTYRLLDRLHGRLVGAGFSPRAIANGLFWLLRIK
jgi:hypothetical protein